MGFLKKGLFFLPAWGCLVVFLSFISIYTYQTQSRSLEEKSLDQLTSIQMAVYANLEKRQNFLNSVAQKAFLDPSLRLPCDLTIYIYNTKKELIKTTDPTFNQLPATKYIDDLFLTAPLSQTSQWCTVYGLNRAKPEIFYISPIKKDNKLEGLALFRFQNAGPFLEDLLRGVDHTFFSGHMFAFNTDLKEPFQYGDNLGLTAQILDQALNGEQQVIQQKTWLGLQNEGVFYMPSLRFAFIFQKKVLFSVVFILEILLLGALLSFGLISFFSNFSKVFTFFVFILGVAATGLGFIHLSEKKELTEKKQIGYKFAVSSTAFIINQYIDEYKGVLDTFSILKYQLKTPDPQLRTMLDRYEIFAVNFYENPQKGGYQNITTLSKQDWSPTSLVPDIYTEEFKIDGPINDPILGSIFIFSTQKNIPNQGTCSIIVSAQKVNNSLEILKQGYQNSFAITSQNNYVLYQHGKISKPNLQLSIPAANWLLSSYLDTSSSTPASLSTWISFLFVTALFLVGISLLVFAYFDTIFGLEVLPVVSFSIVVYAIAFQVFCYRALEDKSVLQLTSIHNKKEEIETQVASINQAYDLLYDQPLKMVSVKLSIDDLIGKGIDILNAKGSFTIPLDQNTKLFIYTVNPGTLGFEGAGDSTPSFYFNNDFIDNSTFREYPFNSGELRLPLQATSSETLLFVPDFDNLEQVSTYLNNHVVLKKIGCRYVYKEGASAPTLEYVFSFQRSILHPLVSFLLPILIALGILFQSYKLYKKEADINLIVGAWGPVMFIFILTYAGFRGYMGDRILSFLENIFIGTFFLLIVLQFLLLNEKVRLDERFYRYVKYFFWPTWLCMTMIVSYIAVV
jgi:hypothetical protein